MQQGTQHSTGCKGNNIRVCSKVQGLHGYHCARQVHYCFTRVGPQLSKQEIRQQKENKGNNRQRKPNISDDDES